MISNKALGYWWITTIVMFVLGMVTDDGTAEGGDPFYTLAGIGLLVFGTWGIVRLNSSNKQA